MTATPEPLVQPLQHEFHNRLADVMGPEARARTAETVDFTLFRRRWALGAALLRWCLVTRAAVRPAEPVTAPAGTRLAAHDQRPTPDAAVGGTGRFPRHDCTAPGPEGCGPLDAERRVPACGDADRRRAWTAAGAAVPPAPVRTPGPGAEADQDAGSRGHGS